MDNHQIRWSRMLLCFFIHAVRVNEFFINFIDAFFWLVIKFKKLSSFTTVFRNLLWLLKKFIIFLIYLSMSTITIESLLSDFWIMISFFWDFLEYQILLFTDVEGHCCYKCQKNTVLYPCLNEFLSHCLLHSVDFHDQFSSYFT